MGSNVTVSAGTAFQRRVLGVLEEQCCTSKAQPASMGPLQSTAGSVPSQGCSSQAASSAPELK